MGTPLSPRERQVFNLRCKGMVAAEIAAELGVRVATVVTHNRAILAKTGARSMTHAAAILLREERAHLVGQAYESGYAAGWKEARETMTRAWSQPR